MMVQAGRAELSVTSITGKIIFEGGAGVASSISDGNRNRSKDDAQGDVPVVWMSVGRAGVQSSIICSCLDVPELCLTAGVQRFILS